MNHTRENIKPYGGGVGKTEQIEQMFDNIAGKYDVLNHTLSFGIDRNWRREAIDWLKPFAPRRIMDVATGTGDFAMLAFRELQPERITGTDISEGMMNVGRKKVEQQGLAGKIDFAREDSASLSFAGETFDAVTVAFGIRNFENLDKSLSEMYRVLKKGGKLVVLELTTPAGFPMKQLFSLYSNIAIPVMGRLLSKDKRAYTYLPRSIRAFPQGEAMRRIMGEAGFEKVEFKHLTFGICTLYTAAKPANGGGKN